ncbi:hypothetical protein BDW22DRAFT_863937 [Trametopsis cervina]|nr:hypothetical protein BDW22DRAFT_863937 [Trametopsis cervina]
MCGAVKSPHPLHRVLTLCHCACEIRASDVGHYRNRPHSSITGKSFRLSAYVPPLDINVSDSCPGRIGALIYLRRVERTGLIDSVCSSFHRRSLRSTRICFVGHLYLGMTCTRRNLPLIYPRMLTTSTTLCVHWYQTSTSA